MEWFESLYDDFRQRTGFGSLPADRTKADVDFLVEELSLVPGSKVLDLFSGTGRHSIEFARRGIHAVGVELNPEYVGLAKQRAHEAGVAPQFVTGDVRTVPFGSGYDAAIVMWSSFGYFSDEEDRAVIRKVHSALNPGGRDRRPIDLDTRLMKIVVEKKCEQPGRGDAEDRAPHP